MKYRFNWVRIFSHFIMLGFLLSCATTPMQDFSRVKNGQDKTDVLDLAGSPHHKARIDGLDVWKYQIPENGKVVEKEIYFKNERVNYVGNALTREDLIDKEPLDSSTQKSAGPAQGNDSKVLSGGVPGVNAPETPPAGSNFKEVE